MKVLDMGGKMTGLLHTTKTIASVSLNFRKLSIDVSFSEATLISVAFIQKDDAKYMGAFVEFYKNWAEELQSVFDELIETNLQAPADEDKPNSEVDK
jgi:deoxyribodipyrimidine photolyase